MLPFESGGVVGPDLLVHRMKGLSVVDASIMQLVPSTTLCATVYAVAEKVRTPICSWSQLCLRVCAYLIHDFDIQAADIIKNGHRT